MPNTTMPTGFVEDRDALHQTMQGRLDRVGSFATPSAPSFQARRATAESARGQRPLGFIDVFGDALEKDQLGSALKTRSVLGPANFAPDPNFSFTKLDPEQEDILFGDLPEDLHDAYGDFGAVSFEHAQAIRAHLDRARDLEERLQRAGWAGIGARVVATVIDPVTLVSLAATGGSLEALRLAKLGRMLTFAGVGAATEGTIETVLASTDPYRDGTDVLIAASAGAVLGGMAGALFPGTPGARITKHIRDGVQDAQSGVRYGFEEAADGSILVQRLPEAPDVQPTAHAATQGTVRGSVGAMENPVRHDFLTRTDQEVMQTWDRFRPRPEDTQVAGVPGISLYASLARSTHAGVAWLADRLTPNPIGKRTSGQAQQTTIWEESLNLYNTKMAQHNRVRAQALRDWLKEQGQSSVRAHLPRVQDQFDTQVAAAVRGAPANSAAVNRVAQAIRANNAALLRRAKEAGVKGFENVTENPNYLQRRYRVKDLQEMRARVGDPAFFRFLARALQSGARKAGKPLDFDTADVIARTMTRTIVEGKYGVDGRVSAKDLRGAIDTVKQELAARLGNRAVDVDEAMVEEALTGFIRDVGDTPTRARRRVLLDELYAEDGLRVSDFLENNSRVLQQDYVKNLSGLIALARAGFPGDSEWEAMLTRLRRTGPAYDTPPDTLKEQIDSLEMIRNIILGRPITNLDQHQVMRRVGRGFRAFNFSRLMGVVGWAQLPEAGNLIGVNGMRVLLQHIPALRGMIRRLKDTGRLDDDLADELETVFALGTERLNMDPSGRLSTFGTPEFNELNRLDQWLQQASLVTSDLSGMNAITAIQERMAGRAILQNLANAAHGRTRLSPQRLLSLGIDDGMAQRIYDQMRAHTAFVEGSLTGRRVARMNMEDWTDQEAADTLINAVQRFTRRAIQKNDPGDLPKFMHRDLAKTLFQFQTFGTVAFEKQLLHGLAMGDVQTAQSFLATMFLGGLAYIGLTAAQSVGREDGDDFLEERLSPERVAAAAFYRGGWSSLLPQVIDTGTYLAGQDPVFQYARTTGLGTTLASNPTLDLIDTVAAAGRRASLAAVGEEEWRGEDSRRLMRAMPFQNVIGISNTLDLLAQD